MNGLFVLLLAQGMIGINIVCSKYLLSIIPFFFLLAIRFSTASLIILPMHWFSKAKHQSIHHYLGLMDRRAWLYIIAQAMSAGVLFNFFMLLGLKHTDANIAGIITSTLPAIIALMCWVFLKEKISLTGLLCIGLATIGMVIIGVEKWHGLNTNHSFIGDLLVLISMLPEASYYVLCKLCPSPMPLFLTASILNALNALALIPLLFIFDWSTAHLMLTDWLLLFGISLSSGLFYVFWLYGSQRVESTQASLSTAVVPLSTVFFSWLLLGEQLTLWQYIGMGCVILSIVVYARR